MKKVVLLYKFNIRIINNKLINSTYRFSKLFTTHKVSVWMVRSEKNPTFIGLTELTKSCAKLIIGNFWIF